MMEWIRGKVVGRGSFGTVNLATIISKTTNTTQNQSKIVVKSSDISTSSSLVNEKQVLTKLGNNHTNIIHYFGDSVTKDRVHGSETYNLFLEYASKGSLADQIRQSSNGKFDDDEVARYTRGVLKGLDYVHGSGFVHGDLKLQNILVFDDGEAKLADFGLSRRVGEFCDGCELRGTPLYMSPEIIAGGRSKVETTAVDIWAVGCAVVEMVTGKPVWECSPGSDVSGLFYRIGVRGECPKIPGELCDVGKDFLSKCFLKDPNERWTAQMLLDHPFLSGFDTDFDKVEQPSVSPKCPFEFPDWESTESLSSSSSSSPCSIGSFDSDSIFDELDSTCSSSVLSRFDQELDGVLVPDWDDLTGWVTVR